MKLANSLFKLGTENAFVVLAKAKALEAKGSNHAYLGARRTNIVDPVIDRTTAKRTPVY